ncbi:CRISPR-associated endonuclease Cas2 [Persephonella sp.]|uniref:CRISPR-associated endonuclease Cas2 n=1 Tax=Persephonella sp. TaxID=2060922 RepID=UPI0025F3A893|nr:CRISPR-associated endonuclease Cas2 [Persephonella sp.]
MRYLVAYDIPDDKRRRKVFKFLLGYGFNVEFSIFEIYVDNQALKEVVSALKDIINPKEDSIYIFPYFKQPFRNGVYRGKNYGDIFL